MDRYIFEDHEVDKELDRLQLIEAALDSDSISCLRRTGIRHGWHCLEVGAGAGSIARWMAGSVGPEGRVIAVDTNASYLQPLSAPPYEVVEGSFLDVAISGAFDLAHCRYVLIHNEHSHAILQRLCALLKPGGFLVVEEPDFTSAKLLGRKGDVSQQRVNDAICCMFEQRKLDPAYGLGLPEKVAAEGLNVLHVESRMHLNRGGDRLARMMAVSTRALGHKYLETGEADATDIAKYIENANNHNCWALYYSTVSVIAVKR